MIFIERGPEPDFLRGENNIWILETNAAIAHYSIENQNIDFKFVRYRSPEMKKALRNVFGEKCAYCESKYASVSDGDVEHFRPKGRVDGKIPATPGYYWLSNDWSNLLLSCQHCNQARRHKTTDNDGQVLNNDDHARGKLDKFPLTHPEQRVTSHLSDLRNEYGMQLLLNPCIDEPEDHFEYHETHALIIPLTDKAEESIDVYVLQRQYLVQNRRERLTYLLAQIDFAKEALELFNEINSERTKTLFDKALENLLNYTKKESEYSGMCRFFVRKFMAENGIIR